MTRKMIVKACLMAASVVPLILTSCASKKFVTATVDPLESRIKELESQSTEQTGEIEELRAATSRADEKAETANSRAQTADSKAETASGKADSAQRQADEAVAQAIKNMSELDEVNRQIASLDEFDLASTEIVLFGLDSSDLSDEERAKLDHIAGLYDGTKPYVIEIQGFTDKTGSAAHNLELSRKRAEGVSRYLTTNHQVPLRRIYLQALGSANPTADNSSRDGRKLNRRVEVRLYLREPVTTAQQ